jgi:hypothetical protein
MEDFDFLIGQWEVANLRLKKWLCGCSDWFEFTSFHRECRQSSGVGTVGLHEYTLNHCSFSRSVFRYFDQQRHFWRIDRLDDMAAIVMLPLKGSFWENKGSFISKGLFEAREVLVWVEWTKLTDTCACWEQALSGDNGRTWETNWLMEFYKLPGNLRK